MRLRRIKVSGFRKITGCVEIDGLGDGITVVSGDNEEGKSTVLAALQAALFERHNVGGDVQRRMLPYSAGTPAVEVEIDFDLDGGRWCLRKRFKRGVELTGPGTRLRDDAADDRLQTLLRFVRRSARVVQPVNHGIQAVFWVDQGTSFRDFDALAAGRERFQEAIATEVGVVTGGERTLRLTASVQEQCARFWTPHGKEKGVLAETRARVAVLERELAELQPRAAAVRAKTDRLERLRAARDRRRADDAVGRARKRAEDKQRELTAAEAVRGELAIVREQVKSREAELARRMALRHERMGWREELGRLRRELAQATRTLGTARETRAAAVGSLARAEVAEIEAVERRRAADSLRNALDRTVEREGRRIELRRSVETLRQATDAADQVARRRGAASASAATAERQAQLRRLDERARAARAALDAVATTIELHPEPGRTTIRDGLPLDPFVPLRLTEPVLLQLEGFGSLRVLPGGDDVGRRRAELRKVQDELGRALEAIGAADLVDAERLAVARLADETGANEAAVRFAAILTASGSAGLDVLSARVAELESGLDAGSDEATPAEPPSPAARRAALDAQQAREAETDRARAETRSRGAAVVTANEAAALAGQVEQRLRDDGAALADRLVEAEALQGDVALDDAVATATAACREVDLTRTDLEGRLRRLDPDATAEHAAIATRAVQQLEAEAQRQDREMADLEIELRALGDDGLGERLAEGEERLRAAHEQLGRVHREASAWHLLAEELRRADAAQRERLTRPVLARITPWLTRLFPEAAVELDQDSLAPARLRRDGSDEPIGGLSLGTREQIAILVRLGLAQLLTEQEGEAPCLILDDALVYADEGRLSAMKAILQRAGQTQQIIVLTCRPRDYAGLDGRHLQLRDCAVSSAHLVRDALAD